ncbi:ABC transporter ATP-binding protein [Anaerolentibacter hominis]|uniref:ABC transporter ATP-binding protein n=1 Tax=Anaerolentibacter hominis TaxID=3079009 RepID=UPI0031B85D69
MIELRHITAGYGGEMILSDLSLSCPDGQVTVLCGPNGCGKSTVIKVVSRFLEPAHGEVLLDGKNVRNIGVREFAQSAAVMPQMRGSANITAHSLVLHGRFPYLGYPRRYSRTDKKIVREAMERTGTWEFASKPVSSLSGGERQKVYLAMCLAQDTRVLLLDEPTTYLDIEYQLELMQLIRQLAGENRTVLMVLHDLNLAMTCADQMIVMEKGQIRLSGKPEEIYESGVIERVFHVKAEQVRTPDGGSRYFLTL